MLSRSFANQGLGVELLTYAPADPRLLVSGLDERVGIVNLGPGHQLSHVFQLGSYLAQRGPRVLLAAGPRANRLAAGCRRRARGSTRIFLGVHNVLTPGLSELGSIRRMLRIRDIRRSYLHADGVICVSAGVADDLLRYAPIPAERLSVIHNPVLDEERLAAPGSNCPHPWLAPGEPPVILGAGRLTPQKDFPTLLRAFALLAADTDHRLLIIGEGDEREALQRLTDRLGLRERVAFPGFVDDPLGYMRGARLFVLSSAWEGFGNVLVEAMAVATPVVSTDCPSGPREILRDGALGPLVPPGDPKALADAMRAALARPTDADQLRRRAREFSAEVVARRYLDVLFPAAVAA
jgi:glycosyltransferase involved in cell wall biosynthesis